MDGSGPFAALEHVSRIIAVIGRRRPAFFTDFDGTLSPIVQTPSAAALPRTIRELIVRLAERHLVCVISGRGMTDLRSKIDVPGIYYAADHGHHILGPEGSGVELEVAPSDSLELEKASYDLERRLRNVQGSAVETKGVSLSVHYRMVAEGEHPLVEQIVREVAADSPGLRLTTGKCVFELTPDLGWDKGQAVLWLTKRLGLRRSAVCPVCLGDDTTDESMFRVVGGWGIGLLVGEVRPETQAGYVLADIGEVTTFLELFAGEGLNSSRPAR